jgi:hypothetical protein
MKLLQKINKYDLIFFYLPLHSYSSQLMENQPKEILVNNKIEHNQFELYMLFYYVLEDVQ